MGVLSRLVSGLSGGPRLAYSNAWCAICNSEFELPEGTPILQTLCGCCRQKLIPHTPERSRLPGKTSVPGRCPHCSRYLVRRNLHRHVRCPACATAVSPIPEGEGS